MIAERFERQRHFGHSVRSLRIRNPDHRVREIQQLFFHRHQLLVYAQPRLGNHPDDVAQIFRSMSFDCLLLRPCHVLRPEQAFHPDRKFHSRAGIGGGDGRIARLAAVSQAFEDGGKSLESNGDTEILRKVLAQMQAAERGLRRLEAALKRVGPEAVVPTLRSLRLNSLEQVDCLESLKKVVLAAEEAAGLINALILPGRKRKSDPFA
jgi:hypothetical protein